MLCCFRLHRCLYPPGVINGSGGTKQPVNPPGQKRKARPSFPSATLLPHHSQACSKWTCSRRHHMLENCSAYAKQSLCKANKVTLLFLCLQQAPSTEHFFLDRMRSRGCAPSSKALDFCPCLLVNSLPPPTPAPVHPDHCLLDAPSGEGQGWLADWLAGEEGRVCGAPGVRCVQRVSRCSCSLKIPISGPISLN